MAYDELMLMCAKARQRDLWQEVQHNALVRRAQAARGHWSERCLLRISHVLIVWGLQLRALCRPTLAKSVSTYLELLDRVEQPGGRAGLSYALAFPEGETLTRANGHRVMP